MVTSCFTLFIKIIYTINNNETVKIKIHSLKSKNIRRKRRVGNQKNFSFHKSYSLITIEQ